MRTTEVDKRSIECPFWDDEEVDFIKEEEEIKMNKVILLGNLTKEPQLTYAAGSETAIAKFTLTVSRPLNI